jgi:hypothetical protein
VDAASGGTDVILLRILAALAFLLGFLAAEGWLLNQSVPRAVAFVALGLAAWVVSTFPVPDVPPSR